MVDLAKLTAPMPFESIEWRIQRSGVKRDGKVWATVVPYADARYLMDVLDEACGPAGWRDHYMPGPDGGVKCVLSLLFGEEWISKEDGAPNTDIEAVKGGYTASFRRACVKWNVAGIRGLYDVGDLFAVVRDGGKFYAKAKKDKNDRDGVAFNWDPPRIDLKARVQHVPPHVEDDEKSKPTDPLKAARADAKALLVQLGIGEDAQLKEMCAVIGRNNLNIKPPTLSELRAAITSLEGRLNKRAQKETSA